MSQFVETNCRTFTAGAAIAQYLRVKLSAGKLAAAGATDADLGTIERDSFADGDEVSVRLWNAPGTRKMVAAGAITQYANVYGASGGKVDDVSNEKFIGIALEAATGDGSIIEVLPQAVAGTHEALGAIDGNLVIDDDFIGDWPAAASALAGQGPYAWTKTETNALGVISVDAANGILKFSADAVAEAATCALYMANSPVDIDDGPIFECILAVYDIGDNAAVDIDFGLASDSHATDFEAIAAFAAFHLDGTDLSLKTHTDDGTTDNAPADSTVDLVDDTYYAFKIDLTDKANIKFYYRALGVGQQWTRLNGATTYAMAAYTGALTPIVLVEKTSDDSTFDVRCDRIRVQCPRAIA